METAGLSTCQIRASGSVAITRRVSNQIIKRTNTIGQETKGARLIRCVVPRVRDASGVQSHSLNTTGTVHSDERCGANESRGAGPRVSPFQSQHVVDDMAVVDRLGGFVEHKNVVVVHVLVLEHKAKNTARHVHRKVKTDVLSRLHRVDPAWSREDDHRVVVRGCEQALRARVGVQRICRQAQNKLLTYAWATIYKNTKTHCR